MPQKKGIAQGSFTSLKKEAEHESKKSYQQQENNDENVSNGRGEIARQLALGDRFDIGQRVIHFRSSLIVSESVILRKTSSKRPSSVCSSSMRHPSLTTTSETDLANSPLRQLG